MFSALRDAGFQIEFHAHAAAILSVDFPEVATQLEEILRASTIPIEEIVGSGGGFIEFLGRGHYRLTGAAPR